MTELTTVMAQDPDPAPAGPARTPVWVEGLQLIPVMSLALPFVLRGAVDVSAARRAMVVAALLTVPTTALVLWRRCAPNPILLGTAVWLWVGAIAFQVPVETLVPVLEQLQASGLFVAALAVGAVATMWSPHGYVGCRTSDRRWLRRASVTLLLVNVAALAVAWGFRHNVRLGGGLPFVLLNVARRLLCARAPQVAPGTEAAT